MPVVFRLIKMSFGVPKKVSYDYRKGNRSEGFREMDQKSPNIYLTRLMQVPLQ